MPSAFIASSNRNSVKPASIASISGAQDELSTHLGLLPSSPNVLVLPTVNIPSAYASLAPASPGSDFSPKIDVRDLVVSTHAAYAQRQAQAEGFVVNHPSRAVILQKGWVMLLAECAQLLLDAGIYLSSEEAVTAIKGICDGGIEEVETEEEIEVEVDLSDAETDRTPVIEEEPFLEDELGDDPIRPQRVSQLSYSPSTCSSTSATTRPRLRTSDRSVSSSSLLDECIDERDEDRMVPLRTSRSTIDLQIGRSHSQASLRESMTTPPPCPGSPVGGSKRRSAMGRDGKRFPVKAVSMDNLSTASNIGLGLYTDKRLSTSGVETKSSVRESILVAERRRVLEEKLAEERMSIKSPKLPLEYSDPISPVESLSGVEKRKSHFQHTRTASQKSSRDIGTNTTNSPRVSTLSISESRCSTPTRWSDEIPKKKTKRVMEKRRVKTIKTHPPLKFHEDVMVLLHSTETSPTFIKLIDLVSVTMSMPSTPYSASFPTPLTGYPSPPISPTTPTIVVEQPHERTTSMSSISSTPRLSLFPVANRPRVRDSVIEIKTDYPPVDLKSKVEYALKELPQLPVRKPTNLVKKINVGSATPLVIQNEIRTILGDSMTAVRKFPTVVQGLALGMGLGLGLLNGGGESLGNKFWSPVLGGSALGSSVDLIMAVGWEKGCEKLGQKLLQRLTNGLGRCGPAHCVSLSYLLSLSLHQLNPSSASYTSQVHAALSGKYLVPQIEEYLSVNAGTRSLIITFDAATIPNANLEPIRELRRVLDGSNPDSSFKIISVIGGPVEGHEESVLSPKEAYMPTPNFSKPSQPKAKVGNYRTSPVPSKTSEKKRSQSPSVSGKTSPNLSPDKAKTGPRKAKSSNSLKHDEKVIMRRRELSAISDVLIVDKANDMTVFEGHIGHISAFLRDREEKTGSYKAWEGIFESSQSSEDDTLSGTDESSVPEEEDDDDSDDSVDVSYSEAVMSIGALPRSKSHSSGWSKLSWTRDLLGKKKSQAMNHAGNGCGPIEGGSEKAYRLLGLDS